jgi:hypothetical protein
MRKKHPGLSNINGVLSIFLFGLTFLFSCATFRSKVEGTYQSSATKNLGSEKVSIFFLFSHLEQSHGYDAIPKIQSKWKVIHDFDDIFRNALNEISNIGSYSTFTESADDVNYPNRRVEIDSLKSNNDYTIYIKFLKEKSFAKHFLASTVSTLTLTIIPLSYSWRYSIQVELFDNKGTLIKNYERSAKLKKWVHALLFFVYPFYNEKMKEEEIYIEFLNDVFKQIESEKILKHL